jgi:hypothetical protein
MDTYNEVIEVPFDPNSYSLAKKADALARNVHDTIQKRLPPATNHYIHYVQIPLGLSGVYPPYSVGIPVPMNSIVMDVSILFQLLAGETQTVRLIIDFSDMSSYSLEISASSTEGTTVEKRLSNYQYYVAMGGSYPGPTREVLGPKNIVALSARSKTNLSTPGSTRPGLFVRYYTIG